MLEEFQLYNNIKEQLVVIEVTAGIDIKCGTAFHIGEGLLVTAKHNVREQSFSLKTQEDESIPFNGELFLSNDSDIAVLKTGFLPRVMWRSIQTGKELLDEISSPMFISLGAYFASADMAPLYLLSDVFLFGFPPIPMTNKPELVAMRAQVNAFVKTRQNDHNLFILSSTARGGFSGGPVIDKDQNLIGICIEALYRDHQEIEMGFAAAVCIDPLFDLLHTNNLYPAGNDELIRQWPNRIR